MAWTVFDGSVNGGPSNDGGGDYTANIKISEGDLLASVFACLKVDGYSLERNSINIDSITPSYLGFPLAGEPSGELEFTTGGGTPRPTTGFLYPRGDC